MPFFTYILQSKKTNQYYIGQTNNLLDRLHRHNSNQNNWTKNKGPWIIIFSIEFESRSEAVALEKKLKTLRMSTIVKVGIPHLTNNLSSILN